MLGLIIPLIATLVATDPANPSNVTSEAPSSPAANAPGIRDHSSICVSVDVDQRIWTTPLTPASEGNFSAILSSALRRLQVARGGTDLLPGPRRYERFVTDPVGVHPRCQDAEAIHVAAHYGPRPDGGPFVFTYRINRGSIARSGSDTRDVAEGIRTGQRPAFVESDPLQGAIYDDLRARAQFILRQIDQIP